MKDQKLGEVELEQKDIEKEKEKEKDKKYDLQQIIFYNAAEFYH